MTQHLAENCMAKSADHTPDLSSSHTSTQTVLALPEPHSLSFEILYHMENRHREWFHYMALESSQQDSMRFS